MKRSFLVISILLLMPVLLCGCSGGEGDGSVLIIEDEKVPRKEFEYQLVALMSAYEYYNGSPIDWSQPIDGLPPEKYFRQQASDTALLYRTVKIMGEELGLGLTEDELARIDRTISNLTEQAGGKKAFEEQLESQGLDLSLYRHILTGPEAYYKIFLNLYSEGAPRAPSDDDIRDYYRREYLRTRHIAVYLVAEDGSPLPEDEVSGQRRRIEEAYGRLLEGEDFGLLMDEYNEDSGINGSSLCFSYGEMPEDYYLASIALEPDGFSGILELDGILCIINRLPLEDSFLEENFEFLREECATAAFNELLDEWKNELSMEKTPLYDDIDVRELYFSSMSKKSDG